jgi:hypothetical protein
MQIEGFIIANEANDILFACHFLPPTKNWNEYVSRLVKLIPGWDPLTPFLLHDDVAIGLSTLKDMRLIVTAPLSSSLVIEGVMAEAIQQLKRILNFLMRDDPAQASLLKRDTYVGLHLLIQAEISPSGHMRFGKTDDFGGIIEF